MQPLKFLSASVGTFGTVTGNLQDAITWHPRPYAQTLTKTIFIIDGWGTPFCDGVNIYWQAYSPDQNFSHHKIPGETYIVQEGDTVNFKIINTLTRNHSFVIDGIADTGTIRPGQSANVHSTAKKPGSYMYYDKLNAPYNRLSGLHGGFAVMPKNLGNQLYAGSRTFRKQLFWIFNDIDPTWNEAVSRGQTPSTNYTPRYLSLNGLPVHPPNTPGNVDNTIGGRDDLNSNLIGMIGDRTLIRVLNAGQCTHAVHWHGNHVEWLTENGKPRSEVWEKDVVPLAGNRGQIDVIYPFEYARDA